ncbi:MAG TPA: hypothetical protein H9798_02710 [Candidatus Mediterraneibacter pullicola]|uniref:Spore coat protein U domain-containing protein n=1 Tax=Candidatus Mediterraneibacter pullicola TaxID=2838682 RepID=A0A9D2H925_9FIRM|nr:hypothetical protein [Candidatus Mediterraneibacter pullicola]
MRFIKEARILALCTLFTFIFVLPVMAQTTDVGQIQPRLSNIITCSAKLTINQNGMADASGYLNCRPNIQITYMQLTLQKKSGGSWIDVKSWTASGTGSMLSISKTYKVSRGTYRTKAYVRADSETKSTVSTSVTY